MRKKIKQYKLKSLYHKSVGLIEVLIAVLLIMVMTQMLLGVFMFNSWTLMRERQNTAGLEYMESFVEDLIFNTTFTDVLLHTDIETPGINPHVVDVDGETGAFWDDIANRDFRYTVNYYDINIDGYQAGTIDDDYKKINFSLTWDETLSGGGAAQELKFSVIKVKEN